MINIHWGKKILNQNKQQFTQANLDKSDSTAVEEFSL